MISFFAGDAITFIINDEFNLNCVTSTIDIAQFTTGNNIKLDSTHPNSDIRFELYDYIVKVMGTIIFLGGNIIYHF